MPFKAEELMAYPIPEGRKQLARTDCMLYALGVGLGSDPMDERQLRFVYERDLRVLPTMANVLASPGFWLKNEDTGVDWRRVLHGEQRFTIHEPLPPEGSFVGRTRIKAIVDRGEGKGAFIYFERKVTEESTGKLVCTLEQTTVCRGDGGCGSIGERERRRHEIPKREPDLVCDLQTLPQAALIYRLSGDFNPLHVDPEVARSAGYERPILHGLCTLGVAGHALLRTCCDYDPDRLRGMSVRFTAPVHPGETLRTEIWTPEDRFVFRTRALERDTVVLGDGTAEITG
ncbi:MAG: MaoC/PaaZ C-terminal domain-containing protein [Gammaproteobacteria bacterium]|nr:MaoC/PaaZ C-terminal domain-containing protein [Gammaproteobacteria bacterium]